jgi:D-alanyl-D-alanine carboxypeptidase (penicillin-binding protein 5/6)
MKKLCSLLLVSAFLFNFGVLAEKSSQKDTKSEQTVTSKETDSENGENSKTSSKSEFPKPRAKSAVVIDANSGDTIYAQEAEKKLSPAGTSNIMTAVIALENASLGDAYTVTEDALANVKYDQPQLGIKVGETYTLEQLLYAILLNSDNDAANAIAIGISGTIDAFVEKMNKKAEDLGLSNTHFANPTGLQNENHYISAGDLAALARYAMQNPDFRNIVKTQKYDMQTPHGAQTLLSTNHLVSRYKYPYHYYTGAIGIKSGNSADAGYCLVSAAEKNSLYIISVVMGCDNTDAKDGAYSFTDTAKMLDYIFENYKSVLLARKGDIVYDSKVSQAKDGVRVAITVEDDVYITLKNTADPDSITSEVNIIQDLKAPIHTGDYFGTVTYSYNGKTVKTANVVAANDVKRDFFLHIFGSIFGFIFNPIVLIIIIVIAAIWIRLNIVRNRKRRIRRKRLVSQGGANTSQNTRRTSRTASGHSRSFDRYGKK